MFGVHKTMNPINYSVFVLCCLLISSCAEENGESSITEFAGDNSMAMNPYDVETYDDLRTYLDQKYGDIEELPVAALISSGMRNRVPFDYRLPDGREITVDIIFTENGQRIVDPDFDLESLPD